MHTGVEQCFAASILAVRAVTCSDDRTPTVARW